MWIKEKHLICWDSHPKRENKLRRKYLHILVGIIVTKREEKKFFLFLFLSHCMNSSCLCRYSVMWSLHSSWSYQSCNFTFFPLTLYFSVFSKDQQGMTKVLTGNNECWNRTPRPPSSYIFCGIWWGYIKEMGKVCKIKKK